MTDNPNLERSLSGERPHTAVNEILRRVDALPNHWFSSCRRDSGLRRERDSHV